MSKKTINKNITNKKMMDKKKTIIIVISLIVIAIVYLAISSGEDKISNVAKNDYAVNSNESNQNETKEENNLQVQSTDNQVDGIVINKGDITSKAKFYKYKSENINIEVIAVKASDGTVRTALNTCQVCYDSGRGYYKQQGSYFVCQNCGNKFSVNQIEKVKGGCNPVPILKEDKTDDGATVAISKEYLDSQKEYFSNWK